MLILSSIPAFAQVSPQTTQDYADVDRLVINNKRVFISGMNLAWHNFGSDVGDKALTSTDKTAFRDYLKQIKDAGGNAIRWWLHTDAQNCPKINSNGQVTGIGTNTINNIRTVLDSAYKYGIVVSLTLFSFDLLKEESKANYSSYNLDNNYKFLTVTANLDTYIQKALGPILDAVGDHPAIMCWEVFNEPEGMLPANASGWGLQKNIDYSHIIRFTAKIAAEVHRKTKKMASTGIHGFETQTYFPNYTNQKLKEAADGDERAYLDFYMVHYYPEWSGSTKSPFHNKASHWNMDRPILIGEFPARDWPPQGSNWQTSMTVKDAYEYAYNNGYCGAMSWSMTENDVTKFGNFSTTKPALENLSSKYKSNIDLSLAPTVSSPSQGSSSSKISSSSAVASSSSKLSSSSSAKSSSSSKISSSSNSSSSSSEGPSPIRVISAIPSAKFGIRSLNNGTLLVESNANAEIHLYNTKGSLVQKVSIQAGSSEVRISVPAGIYIVKNAKTGQTLRIFLK